MAGTALRSRTTLTTALASLACAAGAVYLGSSWADEQRLDDANAAGRAGDYRGALADARRVKHQPTRSRALVVEGNALLGLGRNEEAAKAFGQAAELAPNDANLRRDWAVALARAGHEGAAGRQFARAAALDPGLVLPPHFLR